MLLLVEVEINELVKSAEAKPFVVVGIPAFNEEKTIARVVLEAQKHADVVVVCDDGSSDLTCEIAHAFRRRRGQARAEFRLRRCH